MDRVEDFAGALDKTDYYLLDQYWLLLYELFVKGRLPNPYANDQTFEIMNNAGVRFQV